MCVQWTFARELKPVGNRLVFGVQPSGTNDRPGKWLWQVTIGLGVVVASCLAYAVDDPPPTLPVATAAREALLENVLVEFRNKYGLEVSLADKRWENLPVTARLGITTFHEALRDLLQGHSYYLVRHDRYRSTLYITGPIESRSDKPAHGAKLGVKAPMIGGGQAQHEGEWQEVWNEDTSEVEYVRAEDIDANEYGVSEWIELRSTDGEIGWVRPEDLQ